MFQLQFSQILQGTPGGNLRYFSGMKDQAQQLHVPHVSKICLQENTHQKNIPITQWRHKGNKTDIEMLVAF